EIEGALVAGALFAQHRDRLARVVIAIVKKENNLAADLALEAAGGDDLREQKSFRKKTAGLLAETNDRRAHYSNGRDSALRCPNGKDRCPGSGRRSAPSLPR